MTSKLDREKEGGASYLQKQMIETVCCIWEITKSVTHQNKIILSSFRNPTVFAF